MAEDTKTARTGVWDIWRSIAAVIRRFGRTPWSTLATHWRATLLVVGLAVQLYSTWRVIPPLDSNTRPWLLDSLIFEYVGWSLTTGSRLYVDLFALKPPLAFEVPALLALITGGDPLFQHFLAVAITNATVIASALLLGALVYEATENGLAALVAGLALFAMPAFHWRAAFGFKAKHFVMVCGLLGIYLERRDRPVGAGIAAAFATGFWQLGTIFPALVAGLAIQRGDRRRLWYTIGGMVAGGLLMLAPVVVWGAIPAMIVETVFVPLLVTETNPIFSRLQFVMAALGVVLPLVFLAGMGIVRGYRADPVRNWWVVIGAGWFTLQIVLFDLDSYPDLFLLYAFIALGLGLLAGTDRTDARILASLVAIMLVINVATFGGVLTSNAGFRVNKPYHLTDPGVDRIERPVYNRSERQALFWYRVPTATCRPFLGRTQIRFIKLTGGNWSARTCGEFGPAWRAVLSRYG
ncbi:MAG: DolP-mannose mannosyltransferase [Halobacteriales archaeon]|nr:DolP-mannose mannosyltransferase [Halobacteriales archaeon]